MGRCAACSRDVKDSYKFCYQCHLSEKKRASEGEGGDRGAKPRASVGGERGQTVTATKIAEHFTGIFRGSKLSAKKVNRILESLGWITRSPYDNGGWERTNAGARQVGAVKRTMATTGVPYVTYNASILNESALYKAISELLSPSPNETKTDRGNESGAATASAGCVCACGKCLLAGRSQRYKTRDGHYVRSRGEVMIDNFLFTARVPHAYELEVHLSKDTVMLPDFVVLTPKGNVYIEFWGLEGQSDYDSNTEKKKRLYKEYELELIDVSPSNLDDLDAYLSKELAQYGVRTAY